MRAFTDREGRQWPVSINVTAIKRCRALVDVDIHALLNDGFQGLAALLADPCKLVDVIFVLCQGEAEKRGVTDEDFGAALAGDALMAATDAFLAELADFFPDPRERAGIRKVIEKGRRMTERILEAREARIDSLDVDAEARRLIGSSGSSPAPSDSTPDPSPSAS